MLKAIETSYKGYRFRSRLEARWAVFFDALGIQWEYEKEGFDLDGLWYLPDFWLPDQRCWVEIKPGVPDGDDREKIDRFCELERLAVFVGNIPNPDEPHPDFNGNWYEDGLITIAGHDSCYRWCACRTGLHFGIHFEGRGDRIDCGCSGYVIGGRGHSADHPKILAAYRAARSARFEHGHHGN